MKKLIARIVEFFRREQRFRNIFTAIIFTAIFFTLLYLTLAEVVSNVYGTLVGFAISTMALYSVKVLRGWLEDLLKINYNTEELLDMYNGDRNYRKTVAGKDSSVDVAYAPLFINYDKLTYEDFQVDDDPQKDFQLPDFASGHFETLFAAHANSVKNNHHTVRLDKYDPVERKFYLSRSTYFNHLVTNRAVDFLIFDDVSLRSVYEQGPVLNPLEENQFSNHVGINALVFLKNGEILIPRRKRNATISKNKVTSSVAIKLEFPERKDKNDYYDPKSLKIDAKHLLYQNIIEQLPGRIKVLDEDIGDPEITFLGFGQNIYEGGKPQFYFSIRLNEMSSKDYFDKTEKYKQAKKDEEKAKRLEYKKKNKKPKKKKIDQDRCMYVADYDTFSYHNNKMQFTAHTKNGREFTVNTGYEMSYLCNIWNYEACKEEKPDKNEPNP